MSALEEEILRRNPAMEIVARALAGPDEKNTPSESLEENSSPPPFLYNLPDYILEFWDYLNRNGKVNLLFTYKPYTNVIDTGTGWEGAHDETDPLTHTTLAVARWYDLFPQATDPSKEEYDEELFLMLIKDATNYTTSLWRDDDPSKESIQYNFCQVPAEIDPSHGVLFQGKLRYPKPDEPHQSLGAGVYTNVFEYKPVLLPQELEDPQEYQRQQILNAQIYLDKTDPEDHYQPSLLEKLLSQSTHRWVIP